MSRIIGWIEAINTCQHLQLLDLGAFLVDHGGQKGPSMFGRDTVYNDLFHDQITLSAYFPS
ncbi:hypothetical protein [Celeribacter marinus]|nr:hypothetical protein [Celeribacter marinus]